SRPAPSGRRCRCGPRRARRRRGPARPGSSPRGRRPASNTPASWFYSAAPWRWSARSGPDPWPGRRRKMRGTPAAQTTTETRKISLLASVGQPEIAPGAPPHAVHVVRRVLVRIVLLTQEFDEESRPLDAVGALLVGFHAADVGEVDLVDPGVLRGRQLG